MSSAIRIAIVEDSAPDCELIQRSLARYERENGVQFSVDTFADGEDLVQNYTADYDLILMDIQMTFMDGLRAARLVRQRDDEVAIIFVTNAPQYAIEGYQVRAADYLLKPFTWQTFSESVGRALFYHRRREERFVVVALREGRVKLDVRRIGYVEVQDHQLVYHTLDGDYAAKGTMADAESQLAGAPFYRCNRCYLVNLRHVETCRGSDVLVNGDRLQISRRQRRGFMDALNAFINGEAT